METDKRASQSECSIHNRREENPISGQAAKTLSKPNKAKNTTHDEPPTVHPSNTHIFHNILILFSFFLVVDLVEVYYSQY